MQLSDFKNYLLKKANDLHPDLAYYRLMEVTEEFFAEIKITYNSQDYWKQHYRQGHRPGKSR